jgi:hypothetical protein
MVMSPVLLNIPGCRFILKTGRAVVLYARPVDKVMAVDCYVDSSIGKEYVHLLTTEVHVNGKIR